MKRLVFLVTGLIVWFSFPDECSAWHHGCSPVDCAWSAWGVWGVCSSHCQGTQIRSRYIRTPAMCGGSICAGYDTDARHCGGSTIDCVWAHWGMWGPCSARCGNSGVRIRMRYRKVMALCGGSNCPGQTIDEKPCNRFCMNGGTPRGGGCDCNGIPYYGVCCEYAFPHIDTTTPSVPTCVGSDCAWAQWGFWGQCSAPCGNTGMQERVRYRKNSNFCKGCSVRKIENKPCNRFCMNGGKPQGGACDCDDIPYYGTCCEHDKVATTPVSDVQVSTTPTPVSTCIGEAYNLTATCDSHMLVYIDGILQHAPSVELKNWHKTSTFTMSSCTRVIAITCHAVVLRGGILASADNGLTTDTTWRCSETLEPHWERADFEESSGKWAAAKSSGGNGALPWGYRAGISSSSQWIWAQGVGNDPVEHVYCRKILTE